MSSYSFSHEFYQHWTGAPQPVRAAIVQELKDITALLQTDTSFEQFVFSNHDLDAHLDDLYGAHEKQQAAAKVLADEQAALRAEAEQQRLEEERLAQVKAQAEQQAAEEKARAEAEDEQLQKQQASQQQDPQERSASEEKQSSDNTHNNKADASKEIGTELKSELGTGFGAVTDNKTTTAHDEQLIKAIDAKASYAASSIDLSLKDTQLSTADQQMIHELEVHIDDYLTEQMMQLSETLKSWLRAEVTRQLSEKQ
ncbi:hypothetical protein ACS8FD_09130 [Psychrobacter sp. 1U2]|uniref:hypothetical protein n=1 Tax=Psychrobacter sp. 1U2 TaxID=3453577 RepID=UPI003F482076